MALVGHDPADEQQPERTFGRVRERGTGGFACGRVEKADAG